MCLPLFYLEGHLSIGTCPHLLDLQSSLLPSARMHERVTVVTLCVCLSVCFFIVEKAPFSGLKLTSIHSIGDD